MAQTIQRPDGDAFGSNGIGTSTHLITDSPSDNDAGERPVREKLKKTSIASIPRDDLVSPRTHVEAEKGDAVSSLRNDKDFISNNESVDICAGTRGRPLRKRSFDDLEPVEGDAVEAAAQVSEAASGHARKRSRDVRAGAGLDGETRRRGAAELPVQEVDEQKLSDNEMSGVDDSRSAKSVAPPLVQDIVDHDMTDSNLSPRKKRSRDQLDNDTDREQKIPATEEAKAQRRSEENDRDLVSPGFDTGANSAGPADSADSAESADQVDHVDHVEAIDHATAPPPEEGSMDKDTDHVASNQNSKGSFGNPSPLSPFASLASSGSTSSLSRSSHPVKDQPSQTSSAAFAASGFAALSATSTSPFGTLGSLTKTTNSVPFGPSVPRANSTDSEGGSASAENINQTKKGGSVVPSTTLSFGMTGLSAFASSSVSQPTKFGATFGSGFGNAFGGGAKLNSFAAPVGDADLGSGSRNVGVFGQATKDEEEDERSDSEDGALSETAKDQESGEGIEKLQPQDVHTGEDDEESIFSAPRVNLYAWTGKDWTERGKGSLKLNVPKPELDDAQSLQKTGRFIMRAHQTFRVLLNTPIFKQMKIGDKEGKEPPGKTISFAVIEDGKPTPYLVKLNDEEEAKTLYREARKLQEAL